MYGHFVPEGLGVHTKTTRQFQIVQSAIYSCDTVVTQVLTPAILSLDSRLDLFPFAVYERMRT